MKILRFYYSDDHDTETIATGLTPEQAIAHCTDPETSSTTATSPEAVARTEAKGPWFDGHEDEA